MSFDLVLDHTTSIKKDIDYIRTVLNDHLPKSDGSGRPMVNLPSFTLEQNERNQIIEISESIVTRISEINQELNDPSSTPTLEVFELRVRPNTEENY